MDRILVSKLKEIGDGLICPVALVFNEGKILIGLRNYTLDKYKDISVWTLPGGRSEPGELIEKTLRREIDEEVGVNDLKIIKFLGKFVGAKEGDIVYLFLCITSQDYKLKEPEKFSEWRWVKIPEIPKNFINDGVLEFIKKNRFFRNGSFLH